MLLFLTSSRHAVDHTVPVLFIQSSLFSQRCHLPQLLSWGHGTLNRWPQTECCRNSYYIKRATSYCILTHWNTLGKNIDVIIMRGVSQFWSVNSEKMKLGDWWASVFCKLMLLQLGGSNSLHSISYFFMYVLRRLYNHSNNLPLDPIVTYIKNSL